VPSCSDSQVGRANRARWAIVRHSAACRRILMPRTGCARLTFAVDENQARRIEGALRTAGWADDTSPSRA